MCAACAAAILFGGPGPGGGQLAGCALQHCQRLELARTEGFSYATGNERRDPTALETFTMRGGGASRRN